MLWNGFYVFLFAEHMLLGSSLCIQAGMRWKQQQTSQKQRIDRIGQQKDNIN